MTVHLGSVGCPSGVLVILDLGLAHHWERRGVPEHRRASQVDLHSGWIVSAGVESDDASAFVAIPVTELVARYPELQPLLDEEVGAQFTLQEDGSYRRGK